MLSLRAWLASGWAAILLLPWYVTNGIPRGVPSFPALVHASWGGRWWLLPLLLPLLLATWATTGRARPRGLVLAGAAGIAWIVAEGFAVNHHGWAFAWLASLAGAPGPTQPALGWGALVYALCCLMVLA